METSNKTIENNKKIARQSFESFEKKDTKLLDSISDQSKFKLHFPGISDSLNYEASKNINKEYNNAFPDAKVTIDLQIAEGEYVATRITYSGTHKGTLNGVPASNKRAKVSGMSIQRIVNGKIVEQWNEFDALGMMQQIGAIHETIEQHH